LANGNGKEKKATEEQKDSALKSTIEGFRGGLPIDLDRVMENGHDLREDLSAYLKQLLIQELDNQKDFVDKIPEWERLYRGWRDERNFPWDRCSNVATPVTRSNVDALYVRIIDTLFYVPQTIILRATDPDFEPIVGDIEDGINNWLSNTCKLREKLRDPIMQGLKFREGVVKIYPESRKRTVYRYASERERMDENVQSFRHPGTERELIKDVKTEYNGPNIYGIDRIDWVMSSDATDPQKALICGFKKPYRYMELKLKARQGLYDGERVQRLVQPDEVDEIREKMSKDKLMKLEYIQAARKFDIWELWTRYDVDEDGEEDEIVVTYHLPTGTILSAMYNPIFSGYRPFKVLRPLHGEGACEMLEKIQMEIDTLHNQRIDRMSQILMPMYLVRTGCGLDNFKLKPGKVWKVDDIPEEVVKELKFSDTTFSTFTEEDLLTKYADRALGISPAVLGMPTAERPVARETYAHLAESNRKFKEIIENLRDAIADIVMMCIEMFAQYQPEYTYTSQEGQKIEERTIDFPVQYLRDGLHVELFASSEILNQEIRRETNITIYQMLSDYYTKLTPMIQQLIVPEIPPAFKTYLLKVLNVSGIVVSDILRDFDKKNIESIVLKPEDLMEIVQTLQMTPRQPPPGPAAMAPSAPAGPPGAVA
jgi:hypothetical protein